MKTARLLDLTLASEAWPVAANYAILEEDHPLPEDRRWIVAIDPPDPPRRVRWPWHPLDDESLPEQFLRLRHSTDDELLGWIRGHGLLGVEGSPYGRLARRERLTDVRWMLGQYAAARALLASLRTGASDRRLARLTRLVRGGHREPVDGIDWAADQAGMDLTDPAARRTARADLNALEAIGRSVASGLTGVYLYGMPRATRYTIQMRPMLVAVGPAAAVWLRLWDELAVLKINRTRQGSRLLDVDRLRRCESCGRAFDPVRRGQRWCSRECRWRGTKREQRKRSKR